MRYDGQVGFNTVTGRFEFAPALFPQFGLPQAPYYEEPRESPVSTPELAAQYPLVLMTGRRSWEFFHSEHRNLETMREFHPDPLIEIARRSSPTSRGSRKATGCGWRTSADVAVSASRSPRA